MKILFYYSVPSSKRFEPLIAIKGSAFFRRPNYDAMRLAYLTRNDEFYYFDERVEEKPNLLPDIIAFPVPLNLAYYVQTLAQEWRKHNVKTIAYGVYPSLFLNESKRHFDVVVRGDITTVWNRIIEDYKSGELADLYEAGDNPVVFKTRREFEKKYGLTPIISQLRTSYGCFCDPEFRDYCYEGVIYKKEHFWDPREVAQEVARIQRKMIYIIDDDFLYNIEYAKEILSRCWRLKKMWIFQTKGIVFKKYLGILNFLKEHGARIIYLKEDWLGKNLVQKIYNKDFIKEKEFEIGMIHKNRMTAGVKIMLGFEGENSRFYLELLKFLINIKVDFVEISVQTPLPFTETHRRLERSRRVNKDLSLYDKWMPVVRLNGMSQNELYNLLEFLRDGFYSWDSILRRLILVGPQLGFYNTVFFYLVPNLSYRDNFLEKVGYPP
jgi:hypothetical protein|uniref:Radical SAM protein n=1 Tax=candidate division WOR-3 bacterium TaxID=2052148 RepID=A0A7V3RH29_UNCW3